MCECGAPRGIRISLPVDSLLLLREKGREGGGGGGELVVANMGL